MIRNKRLGKYMCFSIYFNRFLFKHSVIFINSPFNCLILTGLLNFFLFSFGTKLSCIIHLLTPVSIASCCIYFYYSIFLLFIFTFIIKRICLCLFLDILVQNFYYRLYKFYKKKMMYRFLKHLFPNLIILPKLLLVSV